MDVGQHAVGFAVGNKLPVSLSCLFNKFEIHGRVPELDDLRALADAGCYSVAGLTLYRCGRNGAPGNFCSSAVAVILRDGFVQAEKIGNLIRG